MSHLWQLWIMIYIIIRSYNHFYTFGMHCNYIRGQISSTNSIRSFYILTVQQHRYTFLVIWMKINLHRRCVLLSDAFYCMNMPFKSLIIHVVYLASPKSLCIEKCIFSAGFFLANIIIVYQLKNVHVKISNKMNLKKPGIPLHL